MPARAIGLCGSHRTGKTTLALALSEKTGIPFVKTSTTEVFKSAGLDPASPMDFETRIGIQHKVLDSAVRIWEGAGAGKNLFITDRTPVDMVAYTLADIQGQTPADYGKLEVYISRCLEAANRFFGLIVVIQPGIPLVYEEGKAALNGAYLEHLNTLVIGFCNDERLRSPFVVVRRDLIALEDRVKAVLEALRQRGFFPR